MAEDREQLNMNGSSPVSEQMLRRYLLCDLDETERFKIDERLLTDDELAQRMSLAESEMIDDYVSGTLNATDRNQFISRFLVTEARKQKLRFASALQGYAESPTIPATVSSATREPKPTWRGSLAALFRVNRGPAWAFAGAAVILMVFVGLIWFVTQRRGSQPTIATNESAPVSAPQASPQNAPSPAYALSRPTPLRKPETKATPAEPTLQPAVASFVLLPGALRGGGEMTRIAVPRGERDVVRLSLILENPGPGTYLAELANADGQTVAVRKNLKPHANGHVKVSFDVPARLIQTDDYQIKLQRKTNAQIESVGRYYFRALPE